MTVKQLIDELNAVPEELLDSEITYRHCLKAKTKHSLLKHYIVQSMKMEVLKKTGKYVLRLSKFSWDKNDIEVVI